MPLYLTSLSLFVKFLNNSKHATSQMMVNIKIVTHCRQHSCAKGQNMKYIHNSVGTPPYQIILNINSVEISFPENLVISLSCLLFADLC